MNVMKTQLLSILYKCLTIGISVRKVKMMVVSKLCLECSCASSFLVKDFTQANFEVEDNTILKVEDQRTGVEK